MFKLYTNYEPMGDQPQAIEKLTNNLKMVLSIKLC